jgi:hypothetical protein
MAVYLYSRDLESRWEGFEVGVADGFIGKFYTGGTNPPKDVSECSTYSYYSRTYRAEPEGKKYTREQRFENPLTKVLTNPDGLSIADQAEKYILEKDATWGTTQEEVDAILGGGDPLEGCKPIYTPIEGVAKKLLIAALLKLGRPDAIAQIEQRVADGWVPVLAFIPDAGSVFEDFSVAVGTAQNERAKMNQEDDPAFFNWLKEKSVGHIKKVKRSDKGFKLWHLNGSLESYSNDQTLFSFYELDSPTAEEINTVNNQKCTINVK